MQYFFLLVIFCQFTLSPLIGIDTTSRVQRNIIPDLLIQNQPKDPSILPPNIFAFPTNNKEYEDKIVNKMNNYEIWSKNKLQEWSRTLGIQIQPDIQSVESPKYDNAMIFTAPGIVFTLKPKVKDETIKKNNHPLWNVYLDIGFFKTINNKEHQRINSTEYDIYINNIFTKNIKNENKTKEMMPISILVPRFRSKIEKLTIEIKISNRPNQIGILYDASLYEKEE